MKILPFVLAGIVLIVYFVFFNNSSKKDMAQALTCLQTEITNINLTTTKLPSYFYRIGQISMAYDSAESKLYIKQGSIGTRNVMEYQIMDLIDGWFVPGNNNLAIKCHENFSGNLNRSACGCLNILAVKYDPTNLINQHMTISFVDGCNNDQKPKTISVPVDVVTCPPQNNIY